MAAEVISLSERRTRHSLRSQLNEHNADSPRKRLKRDLSISVSSGRSSPRRVENDLLLRTSLRNRSGNPQTELAVSSTPQSAVRQPVERPTYDSAAAAAAAAVQGDGKPREERAWEEFHPDLDLDAALHPFTSDEVDGVSPPQTQRKDAGLESTADELASDSVMTPTQTITTPTRRRPGRPPRHQSSRPADLASPQTPKIVPLPAQNPREKLDLPKPSFRKVDTFASYEADRSQQVNYVDKAMAHVGFQETDRYYRSDRHIIRLQEDSFDDELTYQILLASDEFDLADRAASTAPAVKKVEYDMDEQDEHWLEVLNKQRKADGVEAIKPSMFEITMTQIEKEWHALEKRIPKPSPKPPQTQRPRSSSAAAVNGEPPAAGEEQDSKCAVCDDGDCENTNAIVFCDGCDLAVHQECYGVPFIPEGQWLCRKCQLVGRNVPTCIFCPNTEGAFKLTHESRWAHLLCAIWIPEVSLGNTTFMEPIMEVGRVPKDRWRLTCYICNQKMGACIQCGVRNCCQAFHVTCARKAKLFLRMKSTHGGPASLDASVLKAFCDKHSPPEWTAIHDVERSLQQTRKRYRQKMKGMVWADSRKSALAELPQQTAQAQDVAEDGLTEADAQNPGNLASQKKKRLEAQKNIWRLPSGAPIVPSVVFASVETALQRFALRKRKEFVAEACKYWTLKREARRGAALLKRLQLQLDIFSSSELARRNFAAMGAVGKSRLERRIDMSEQLLHDLGALREMCNGIKAREWEKLISADALRSVVDIVYFPITIALETALQKAQHLDKHGVFGKGFIGIYAKSSLRQYTSVLDFAKDIADALREGLIRAAVSEMPSRGLDQENKALDFKEVRQTAKRIVRAIQPILQDTLRGVAESRNVDCEESLQKLSELLANSTEEVGLSSNHYQVNGITHASEDGEDTAARFTEEVPLEPERASPVKTKAAHGTSPKQSPLRSSPRHGKVSAVNGTEIAKQAVNGENIHPESKINEFRSSDNKGEHVGGSLHENKTSKIPKILVDGVDDNKHPKAAKGTNDEGGVPWYLENFEPWGTTITDERWTGRDTMRGLSEELSDIDEDELDGLGEDMGRLEAEDVEMNEESVKVLQEPKRVQPTPSKRRRQRRV